MHLKSNNYASNIILAFFISVNTLIFFNINIYNLYENYAIYVFFAFLVILFLFSRSNFKYKEIFFVIVVGIYLVLDAFIFTKAYGSALTIMLSILFIIIVSKINIKKYVYKTIYICMILTNLYIFLRSIFYNISGSIHINTNKIAVNMLISLMYIIIFLRYYKKNIIIQGMFIGINIIAILNFESRITFIALFIFVFLIYIFPKKLFTNKLFFKLTYFIVVCFSIIIPCFYSLMWKNNLNFSYEIMGKRFFTGREIMWSELFSSLDSIPKYLFGIGDNMIYSNGLLNTHNITLHLIMSCGIIICIVYYLFLINKLKLITQKGNTISLLAIEANIAFLTTIIYGYFENPIQPNRMLYIYMFILICMNECKD